MNKLSKAGFLTDASIFNEYYTNIILYCILYTFIIYFFTKLISRRSTKWFYCQGSYMSHKQKIWLETPEAFLEITTPKAADGWCHACTNPGGRNHIRSRKNFWRTLPRQHYNWWLDCNRFEKIPTYLEELF